MRVRMLPFVMLTARYNLTRQLGIRRVVQGPGRTRSVRGSFSNAVLHALQEMSSGVRSKKEVTYMLHSMGISTTDTSEMLVTVPTSFTHSISFQRGSSTTLACTSSHYEALDPNHITHVFLTRPLMIARGLMKLQMAENRRQAWNISMIAASWHLFAGTTSHFSWQTLTPQGSNKSTPSPSFNIFFRYSHPMQPLLPYTTLDVS